MRLQKAAQTSRGRNGLEGFLPCTRVAIISNSRSFDLAKGIGAGDRTRTPAIGLTTPRMIGATPALVIVPATAVRCTALFGVRGWWPSVDTRRGSSLVMVPGCLPIAILLALSSQQLDDW